MKATGIIKSECCDAPVANRIGDKGTCVLCGKECWAYDTGLAKPLTQQEMNDAAKDELDEKEKGYFEIYHPDGSCTHEPIN